MYIDKLHHFAWQEFQEDTEDSLLITDYLNKPAERLNEYMYYLQVIRKLDCIII